MIKIPNVLNMYTKQIYKEVFNYAYENYWYDPLIESLTVNWHGELFEVANINTTLAEDVIYHMERFNMLTEIKSRCTHFIVTPDVFSKSPIPVDGTDSNTYDLDRRIVVILNGRVFSLIDRKLKSIKFNYNRKTYIFFDKSLVEDMINEPIKTMSVLSLLDFSNVYRMADYNPTSWKYQLKLNVNNRITDSTDTDITEIVEIMHPYIEFDFADATDPSKQNIYWDTKGLKSLNTNSSYVQERIYKTEEQDKDILYYHNRDLLFTTTAIIINRDNTYRICNFRYEDQYDGLELVDKHTIKIHKNEDISKIVFFLKPLHVVSSGRIDSAYDEAMRINDKAFVEMSPFRKNTNIFFWEMVYGKPTLDTLIDWGYKYDLDILRCIQKYFSTIIKLDPSKDYIYTNKLFDNIFYENRQIFRVRNKLQFYPLIFVDNKLITSDYKIIKDYDIDYIIIDNVTDIEISNSTEITVVFVPPFSLKEGNDDIKLIASNRIFHREYFKNVFRINYNPNSVFNRNKELMLFVTDGKLGLLSSYTEKENKLLGRMIDTVEAYNGGSDEYSLSYSMLNNSGVMEWNKFTDGNLFDYKKHSTITANGGFRKSNSYIKIAMNKSETDFESCNMVFMGENLVQTELDGTVVLDDGVIPVKIKGPSLNPFSAVFFDKYGVLANDSLAVLGDNYVSFSRFYDYLDPTETYQNMSSFSSINSIAVPMRSEELGIDLEIDYALVDSNNLGTFNDNLMKDAKVVGKIFTSTNAMGSLNPPYDWYPNSDLLEMKVGVLMLCTNASNKLHTGYTDIIKRYPSWFNPDGTVVSGRPLLEAIRGGIFQYDDYNLIDLNVSELAFDNLIRKVGLLDNGVNTIKGFNMGLNTGKYSFEFGRDDFADVQDKDVLIFTQNNNGTTRGV